ncbi:MAG: hypothetical protein M3281_02950 [Chloroflexota bacterium]|nr:hypothetical protein [Chloroflexota bacterium]
MAELAFAVLIDAVLMAIELLVLLASWLAERVRYRRAIQKLRRRAGVKLG